MMRKEGKKALQIEKRGLGEPFIVDPEGLKRFLATQPDIVAAYLFGSVAKDRARPHSDVDIAVLLQEGLTPFERFERRLRLMHELSAFCNREVDVVVLNDASLTLQNQVLRHGKLLSERDQAARIAFEVKARKMYYDWKPRMEFYYRSLVRELKEGGLGKRRRR